eukprot:g7889.t1
MASELLNTLPKTKGKLTTEEEKEIERRSPAECPLVEPVSYPVTNEEDDAPLNKAQLEDALHQSNLAAETASSPRVPPLHKASLRFKPATAFQQLTAITSVYHRDATYEDNFISLSGARVIFFHFLILVWTFSRVEILLKSINVESSDSDKLIYTAECTRKYTFRRIPLLHYFIPKGVSLKTKTTCVVEDRCIVNHKDCYLRLDFSWECKLPCSRSDWKSPLGEVYTCILRFFAFCVNLVTFLRTYSYSLRARNV